MDIFFLLPGFDLGHLSIKIELSYAPILKSHIIIATKKIQNSPSNFYPKKYENSATIFLPKKSKILIKTYKNHTKILPEVDFFLFWDF
jgi:hypothetical protein